MKEKVRKILKYTKLKLFTFFLLSFILTDFQAQCAGFKDLPEDQIIWIDLFLDDSNHLHFLLMNRYYSEIISTSPRPSIKIFGKNGLKTLVDEIVTQLESNPNQRDFNDPERIDLNRINALYLALNFGTVEQNDGMRDELNDKDIQIVSKVLPYLTQLKKLELAFIPLNSVLGTELAHSLSQMTQLEEINLDENNLRTSGGKELVEAISNFKKLETVSLRTCKLSPYHRNALLKGFSNWTQLIKLDLRYNEELGYYSERPGDSIIESLAQAFPKMKNLKILRLTEVGLGPEGANTFFKYLHELKDLIELELSYNDFADSNTMLILGQCFPSLNQLKWLELESIGMNLDGALILAHFLPTLTQLKRLEVTESEVTDLGHKTILNALPNQNEWAWEETQNGFCYYIL